MNSIRQIGIAGVYGALSGAVAALVLALMNALSALLWSGTEARWYVFLVIMVGAAVIAVLRVLDNASGVELAEQIVSARDPAAVRQRQILVLAASAIAAVAFGGAIGPEAGILAVITELSAFVEMRIVQWRPAERALLAEAGTAGALAGLYGSPPGGAAMTEVQPVEKAPRALLLLAGLCGLFGFLLAGKLLLDGDGLRLHLPAVASPQDAMNILQAVLPAAFGGLAGVAFRLLLPWLQRLLSATGSPQVQTIVGSLAFAALATAFPILRFSGHHEMHELLAWGQEAGMWALLALGLLKALAVSLCLAAGWRGGAIFPLFFAGAAAGGAALWLIPSLDPTVALIAGMTASATVGMGKPIAAMLIAAFLIMPFSMGPLCVGALVGYGLALRLPPAKLH